MEWWIAEAMELAQQRAPLLDDEFAADLAENLQHTWPDHTPAEALAKFFSVMPAGWAGTCPQPMRMRGLR
jgi:hypothetical protein